MTARGPLLRPRHADDVAELVRVLAEQREAAGATGGALYPVRWPLPFPLRDFLVRGGEQAAWVAELDGRPVAHASVTRPDAGLDRDFADLLDDPTERWAVTALFTALGARGHGLGARLLAEATAYVRAQGRRPVLDVVSTHDAALALYRSRGWRELGRVRPAWLPDDGPDVLLMTLD